MRTDSEDLIANAQLCADMRRHDLSKSLLLASRATKFDFDLWLVHPFGLPLVIKLFNHFIKQQDALAMFLFSSFVFGIAHKHTASQRLLVCMDRSLLKTLLMTVEHFNEILFRWDMKRMALLISKELSNYTSRLVSDSRSLGYENHEFMTELRSDSLMCNRCEKSILTCMICSRLVKGLSVFCPKCGHGGHRDHVIDWFGEETSCALGCGCMCMAS
mmetsp:Transcript_28840/g.51362  ORF Transcript_28840/g.51362 Transcript_28840/m.51362 type:complete len:216 (+) Transcript_28840:1571-2218(+)